MIRIVCPFCHAPLSAHELEKATIDGHASLVCPECENVLVTEDETADGTLPGQREAAIHA